MHGATLEEVEYAGHPAVLLAAGGLRVATATGFGPRIIGLECGDSGNLLAVLPGAWLPTGDGGRFHFRGGHRLWVAPEVRDVTYRPDDDPVDISPIDGGGLRARGPVDAATSLRKTIEIRPLGDDALEVRHVVGVEGATVRRHAPWAITQFPVGGRAWLPLTALPGAGPDTLLPDRQVVLWPYTDVGDRRITLRNEAVELEVVDGDGGAHRMKVGVAGAVGRVAHLRDGWLFEKSFERSAGEYVDLGAAAQVYADERFVELETLGSLADLASGAEAVHVERWRVRRAAGDEVRASFREP